jgi:hypothetical protein
MDYHLIVTRVEPDPDGPRSYGIPSSPPERRIQVLDVRITTEEWERVKRAVLELAR